MIQINITTSKASNEGQPASLPISNGRAKISIIQKRTEMKDPKGGRNPVQRRIKLFPRIKRAIPVVAKSESELEKRRNRGDASSLFTEDRATFSSLQVPEPITQQLKAKFEFERATLVQSLVIPAMSEGRDVLAQSQTGSGKTLAFLIPILSRLTDASHTRINREQGTLAIILCPTRELCIQTQNVLSRLAQRFPYIVTGVVMGGQKLKSEKASLRKGITILICTPGRLVDHMRNTSSFRYSNCEFLVLDEADRLLDMGFEADLHSIAQALVAKHARSDRIQCALLSATLDKRVNQLGAIFLRNPTVIDCSALLRDANPDGQGGLAPIAYDIPKGLQQGYVVVPERLRLVALLAFLRWKIGSYSGGDDFKAIVFVSTCDQVEFYHRLCNSVCWPPQPYQQRLHDDDQELVADELLVADDTLHDPIIPAPLFRLHGNMLPNERTKVFQKFSKARGGVMICTDVAARGLDLPSLDWIIQFNPPTEISDYIHRIGRTARLGRRGRALIILSQMESNFISVLAQHGLKDIDQMQSIDLLETLRAESFPPDKPGVAFCNYSSMSKSISRVVDVDSDLKTLASRAFISYTRSYATYPKSLRSIFSVQKLHLGHVASSFGMKQPPTTIVNQQRSKKKRSHDNNDEDDANDIMDADLELDKLYKASVHKADRARFLQKKVKRRKHNPLAEFAA